MKKYTKLLFLLVICTGFAKADIIGGKKTSEFYPVVKISTGTQYRIWDEEDPYQKMERCTATWIKPGVLITAAHCIAFLEFEKLRVKNNWIWKKDFIKDDSEIPFKVNNIIYHIEKYEIHPLFLEKIREVYKSSSLFSTGKLENLSNRKRFDLMAGELNLSLREDHDESVKASDMALIFTKEKMIPAHYNLSFDEAEVADKVVMVGYGIHENESDAGKTYKKYESSIKRIKRIKKLDKVGKISHEEKESEYLRIKKLHLEIGEKLNFKNEKFMGHNEIYKVGNVYTLKGKDTVNSKIIGDSIGSGDSGGPLLIKIDGIYHIIGIASSGYYREKKGDVLGKFAKISKFENIDFIKKHLLSTESAP